MPYAVRKNASVAQSAEQLFRKQQVSSSNLDAGFAFGVDYSDDGKTTEIREKRGQPSTFNTN